MFHTVFHGIVYTDVIGIAIEASKGVVDGTRNAIAIQGVAIRGNDTPPPHPLITPALGDIGRARRAEGVVRAGNHGLVPRTI